MDEVGGQVVNHLGPGWLGDLVELLVLFHKHVGYPLHITVSIMFYKSISLCVDACDNAKMGV
jgi:hypothetical protein